MNYSHICSSVDLVGVVAYRCAVRDSLFNRILRLLDFVRIV